MTIDNVQEVNRLVSDLRACLKPLYTEMERIIVGQRAMIDRLLTGLLTGGHILLEGVPGLAKTLAVRTLAQGLRLGFHRIQFTPDLLPADVIGTQIFNPRTGEFTIKKGPIFANLVLADEINRAPAKVQSALLEAMQENQVTIGDTSYPLDQPFLVLATQNPIEQEGTYPLPEAQVDRFMLKLKVTYPNKEEELLILKRMAVVEPNLTVSAVLAPSDLFQMRQAIDQIYIDEKIQRLHRGYCRCYKASGRVRFGYCFVHPVRGQPPRDDLPDPGRQGAGVPRRSRLRHAPGRQSDRPRCAAPSRVDHLRGRGRGNHLRKPAAAYLRSPQSAIKNPKSEIRNPN